MTASRLLRLFGFVIPGLLFTAALALFIPRIEIPVGYVYDEVYHAYTAGEYVRGNADAYLWDTVAPRQGVAYMWNHPPLGVLLIAGGIRLYGNEPYGWRISSAIFGAIGIALAYVLALRLTRRRAVAILAACLLLMDGLYFVQSRTAMLDIFLTVFMMAAMLAFHAYLTAPAESGLFVVLTGTFLGLAIATKWSAAYPAAIVGCIVLVRSLRSIRRADEPGTIGVRISRAGRDLGWAALGLVLIPAAIYLAAYIPFFATGHRWDQFVELQNQILYYHSHLRQTHTYQSKWWQWPLALRPVWYHVAQFGDHISNVYANANLILALPSFLRQSRSSRSGGGGKFGRMGVLTGFFGQWLPWAVVPRISFAYYSPGDPTGCIAVAVGLAALFRRGDRRVTCVAYVVGVPHRSRSSTIYAAVPLTKQAFELRMLLLSWR